MAWQQVHWKIRSLAMFDCHKKTGGPSTIVRDPIILLVVNMPATVIDILFMIIFLMEVPYLLNLYKPVYKDASHNYHKNTHWFA